MPTSSVGKASSFVEWGLFCVVVLAFLSVAPIHLPYDKSKVRRIVAEQQIEAFMRTAQMYREDNDEFPRTLDAIRSYLPMRIPEDPWGHSYVYELASNGPRITSYGADGQPGGEGINADIVSHKP